MPKNIVIHVGPIKLNLTPYGFHKYATDYLNSAENITKIHGYNPVPYFLTCRSIELGLKAYLLAKGKKLNYVKNTVSHDLEKGLNFARSESLDEIVETTDIEKNQILIANNYYKSKSFEYFFVYRHVTGLKDLPDLVMLKKYATKLLTNIKRLTDNTDVD